MFKSTSRRARTAILETFPSFGNGSTFYGYSKAFSLTSVGVNYTFSYHYKSSALPICYLRFVFAVLRYTQSQCESQGLAANEWDIYEPSRTTVYYITTSLPKLT